MNFKDLAIEFTETNYSTRDQLIDYYGYMYNEEIWWEICRYRKNFSVVFPLQCNENSNVFVVLYAKLAMKLDNLSRHSIDLMVLFNEVAFNKSFFYNHKNYFVKSLFEDVLWLLKIYGVDISVNTLIQLVTGKKRSGNKQERFARNLFMILYRLVFIKAEKIVINNEHIKKIGSQLGSKNFFRTDRWYLDIDRTMEAGFDPEAIQIKFKQLLAFIHKKTKLHALVKATAVFYYFKLGIIVNTNIDLIATYLFLYTLKISGMPQLVLTIPFIKTLIKKSKAIDDAYYNCVQSNNDITYLLNVFIEILEIGIKDVKNSFINNPDLAKTFSKKEKGKMDAKMAHELKISKYDKSVLEIQSLGLHNKEQLFLKVAANSTQTVYTLEDFQKITNASYEKARYSMNSFVKKGLFTKTKQGKKFLFTVNRNSLDNFK